jgi:hypothetical protein
MRWFHRLVYGAAGADRVELPNPETHQVAWWFGVLFCGSGVAIGAISLPVGLYRGDGFLTVVGGAFVLVFGFFLWFVLSRSVDNLAFDFSREVVCTHEREVPFNRIERAELETDWVTIGRSHHWTWRGRLVEEHGREIDLGTGPFERLYSILRRLAADYGIALQVMAGEGIAEGFEARDSSVGGHDVDEVARAAGMEIDDIEGKDASVRWSYRPPVRFQVVTGLVMSLIVAAALYLEMSAARQLFALMGWMGYLISGGVVLTLAVVLAATLGLTDHMYHRWGTQWIGRSGDCIEYTTNVGRSMSWQTDEVESLVRMTDEPWTGVIVAGPNLVVRLPANDDELAALTGKLEEMVGR